MEEPTKMNNLKNIYFNKPFLLLAGGRFISQLGDKLYLLALPWLVLELTHSAIQSSITFALEFIPQIILAPFIGVYVDRISRKLLMVVSDYLRGVIVMMVTILSYMRQIEMIHIYLAAFLLSALTLLFDSSSEGILPKLVSKERLVEANAKLTFINTSMRLIGPMISGILISSIGASFTIGINAVSFFISAILLSFLPLEMKQSATKGVAKIFEEIKQGFQYLFNHEVLFPIAMFSTFMNIGILLVATLLIFDSKETLGYGPEQTSVIFWVSGFTSTIITLLLKYINKFINKGQIIRFGSTGVLFAILILIFKQNLFTITFSYSLLLIVGIIVNVNMMAYRQEIIPNHLFGRVMTSSRVLGNIFSPISIILSGWLAMRYNVTLVFEIAAIIIIFNILFAWFSKLRLIK